MRIIIWHRNDLRLHDHPLYHSLNETDLVLPVFILDPDIFRITAGGWPKTGAFRANFLQETLKDLNKQLNVRNASLSFYIGKAEEIIPNLVKQHQIDQVLSVKEHTREEIALEIAVSKALFPIQLKLVEDRMLILPEQLPFAPGHLPEVFTEFRKRVEGYSRIQNLYNAPDKLSAIFPLDSLPIFIPFETFGLQEPIKDVRSAFPFIGGESAGIERLHYYFEESRKVATYKITRNGLIGVDYSTKFSPWLANGSLSARKIYHELKAFEAKHGAGQNTYWVFFELLWRDFTRYVAMKYGSRIFKADGINGKNGICIKNEKQLLKWCKGETGNDFIDANMRELLLTGWMSNRGRQNVASFLIKDLKVCWIYGASWFESQLIDYDVCSNYVNWMYIAGVGNDPRENRYFNVKKQAEIYDPQHTYRKYWLDR